MVIVVVISWFTLRVVTEHRDKLYHNDQRQPTHDITRNSISCGRHFSVFGSRRQRCTNTLLPHIDYNSVSGGLAKFHLTRRIGDKFVALFDVNSSNA